ncbi:hypothetical protein AOQ84DRAFT_370266 [Glonium stellatum]|uniref:Uncharacterized protein n=1 Tax=Glonium stellatum TaxID=574774 RepID=A0A8E2EMN7_9PEZI|nr:hypothetical protein AOQ84DRAFT_370266 [Glonium stellatum]
MNASGSTRPSQTPSFNLPLENRLNYTYYELLSELGEQAGWIPPGLPLTVVTVPLPDYPPILRPGGRLYEEAHGYLGEYFIINFAVLINFESKPLSTLSPPNYFLGWLDVLERRCIKHIQLHCRLDIEEPVIIEIELWAVNHAVAALSILAAALPALQSVYFRLHIKLTSSLWHLNYSMDPVRKQTLVCFIVRMVQPFRAVEKVEVVEFVGSARDVFAEKPYDPQELENMTLTLHSEKELPEACRARVGQGEWR